MHLDTAGAWTETPACSVPGPFTTDASENTSMRQTRGGGRPISDVRWTLCRTSMRSPTKESVEGITLSKSIRWEIEWLRRKTAWKHPNVRIEAPCFIIIIFSFHLKLIYQFTFISRSLLSFSCGNFRLPGRYSYTTRYHRLLACGPAIVGRVNRV